MSILARIHHGNLTYWLWLLLVLNLNIILSLWILLAYNLNKLRPFFKKFSNLFFQLFFQMKKYCILDINLFLEQKYWKRVQSCVFILLLVILFVSYPFCLIITCFLFIWVLQPINIISLILRCQSLGGAKMGDPREKTWPSASRTWLVPHMIWARLEPTALRWRVI